MVPYLISYWYSTLQLKLDEHKSMFYFLVAWILHQIVLQGVWL